MIFDLIIEKVITIDKASDLGKVATDTTHNKAKLFIDSLNIYIDLIDYLQIDRNDELNFVLNYSPSYYPNLYGRQKVSSYARKQILY